MVIVNEALRAETLHNLNRWASNYTSALIRRCVASSAWSTNEAEKSDVAAPATVFVPMAQAAKGEPDLRQSSFVLRTTGDPLLLSAAIRNEMRRLDPACRLEIFARWKQLVSRSVAPQRSICHCSVVLGAGVVAAQQSGFTA